ncbi:S1C family serine protease [Thermodesulfobacteriota bacterium]
MRRSSLLVLLFFLVTVGLPADAEQGAEKVLDSIVRISSTIPETARSAATLGTKREGNGVVIDSRGHILTIGYLILEAETTKIVAKDGRSVQAIAVGYDHNTGFGLLRATKPLRVPPMLLGHSSELRAGAPVLVASYGGPDAVQGARVVARREFVGSWEYLLENAIFTVPPHAEFGGAALIGRQGRLVGIGSLYSPMEIPALGLVPANMFVPIDLLKPILSDLIVSGRSREPARPWLGVRVEAVHGRLFVQRTSSGGPAEKAGIKTGDLILSVNAKTVNGLADFYRMVWALGKAGVDVPLSVLQGNRIRQIIIRSADRYQHMRPNPKRDGS